MATVAQVLNSKPEHVIFTIEETASVYDAISMMAQKQIGAVVVTKDGAVVGIMTERDYARKVVLMDRVSRLTPVRDIMSSPVRFVRPNQTTDECMTLMTERRMRHLPVMQDEKLIGDGTTLTPDQFAVLLRYRRALRELSDAPGWPIVDLPAVPDFLT